MVTRRIGRFAVLAAVELMCGIAQDDEFEWFRCDACSASFFKVNKTMVERHGKRSSLPAFEFVETLDNICETAFTKHEFGVKQHEGKKYLFGPGVIDHIPDQGFGQMGMGDYDRRIQAYCRMFIENVGEDELHRLFVKEGGIDKTSLCKTECSSPASGTGAPPPEQKRKKRKARTPAPTPPASEDIPKELWDESPPSPPPTTTSPAPAPRKARRKAAKAAEGAAGGGAERTGAPNSVEEAVALLPRLSTLQLRWLGDAVLGELTKRADAVGNAAAPVSRAEL